MADDSTNVTSTSSSSSSSNRPRRSSFAGQTFADIFGAGPGSGQRNSISRTNSESGSPPQQYPGPITSAAAQAQRRRLSLTTLGLSGSPNAGSHFGSYRGRRDSDLNSANSGSIDESAIEDDYAGPTPTPQTPFGRRVSFGAKALRDRIGNGNGGAGGGEGNVPGQNGTSQPSATAPVTAASSTSNNSNGTVSSRGDFTKGRGAGEGFNWSENFRSRAERTASIVGGSGMQGYVGNSGGAQSPSHHARAKSVAVMEPPAREMPKAREPGRPDHFQERILKGDFYMD